MSPYNTVVKWVRSAAIPFPNSTEWIEMKDQKNNCCLWMGSEI